MATVFCLHHLLVVFLFFRTQQCNHNLPLALLDCI
jgi:hypothetical protein